MSKSADAGQDYSRKAIPFIFAWGIPIAILVSVNFVQSYWPSSLVLTMVVGAYSWMGFACLINAWRCGRLHCYFTGPIFLIGALLIALVGFDLVTLGNVRVHHISYAVIGLALSTFALEWIWGKYGPLKPSL